MSCCARVALDPHDLGIRSHAHHPSRVIVVAEASSGRVLGAWNPLTSARTAAQAREATCGSATSSIRTGRRAPLFEAYPTLEATLAPLPLVAQRSTRAGAHQMMRIRTRSILRPGGTGCGRSCIDTPIRSRRYGQDRPDLQLETGASSMTVVTPRQLPPVQAQGAACDPAAVVEVPGRPPSASGIDLPLAKRC